METKIPDNLEVQQLREMIVEMFKENFSLREQLRKLVPKPLKAGKILSRKKTAKQLQISLPTLNKWSKEGKLAWYKIGIYIIYNYEEVMELARQRNLRGVKERVKYLYQQ